MEVQKWSSHRLASVPQIPAKIALLFNNRNDKDDFRSLHAVDALFTLPDGDYSMTNPHFASESGLHYLHRSIGKYESGAGKGTNNSMEYHLSRACELTCWLRKIFRGAAGLW